MTGPQIILWAIALAVWALCIRRGVPQAKRAVVETNRGFWRILPMFCVALPMAAFLSELVPADIATAWLGDDSGLNGIMIAALAGGVMPGGPFVTFPLVITFSKAVTGMSAAKAHSLSSTQGEMRWGEAERCQTRAIRASAGSGTYRQAAQLR